MTKKKKKKKSSFLSFCCVFVTSVTSAMSKLSSDTLKEAITVVLQGAEDKKRGFQETVELQIGLKNYDTQKDKRFSGTVKLPSMPRPRMTCCVLGDVKHCEEAASIGCDKRSVEDLKKLNKNKKLVKKVKLGKNGICRKLGCGKMDSHETLGLEEMKQQLIEEQAKGKLWAKQEGHQHASLHLRPGRNSEGAIAEFLTGQALSREHYTRASHCASHADGFNVGSWCTTERAG
eukprot:TRINITY_DN5593_c0_g1_i4.p2 TRINITY_DN5593_c0_g1~~TRINITY_DN5593_c0_g1_i4.p2  ORF type:complete len:232 (-),score=21.05 TRINITY_DN5593_c0_g1_i4:202-897(-)